MTYDPVLTAMDKEIAALEWQLADSTPPNPFCYLVADEPGALTSVGEAISAIEAEVEARNSGKSHRYTVIMPYIQDAVVDALAAAHPKHFDRGRLGVICRVVVDSRMRHAAVPEAREDAGPLSVVGRLDDDKPPVEEARQRESDAVEKAAKRIAALRGQF
jgi:hypothetical protein